jgi:hypothetical protein
MTSLKQVIEELKKTAPGVGQGITMEALRVALLRGFEDIDHRLNVLEQRKSGGPSVETTLRSA